MPKEEKSSSRRPTLVAGRHSIVLHTAVTLQLLLSCWSGVAVLSLTSKADSGGRPGTMRTNGTERSWRNTDGSARSPVRGSSRFLTAQPGRASGRAATCKHPGRTNGPTAACTSDSIMIAAKCTVRVSWSCPTDAATRGNTAMTLKTDGANSRGPTAAATRARGRPASCTKGHIPLQQVNRETTCTWLAKTSVKTTLLPSCISRTLTSSMPSMLALMPMRSRFVCSSARTAITFSTNETRAS
mmetsp:Transcript_7489/g.18281  ORF Transcript_7489/g.18281 Transcript_7489/m.18281 type:complete len:242 (+) Transcript_7489:21-746(+)